jgi:hypothetical protein
MPGVAGRSKGCKNCRRRRLGVSSAGLILSHVLSHIGVV